MDKKKRTFRKAMCGFLSVAMLITNLSTSGLTVFAAGTDGTSATETGIESSISVERTVTLGNMEHGSLSFSDSKKSSKDFSVGSEVSVVATPDEGYSVANIAVLDESNNAYSFSTGSDKTSINFAMPEYDVKVLVEFVESDSSSNLFDVEPISVEKDSSVATTADYILAHANKDYVGDGDTLVEADIVWQKLTIVDKDKVPSGITIDELWKTFDDSVDVENDVNGFSKYVDAVMNQTCMPIFAYELSEDSDYYVAYMDTINMDTAVLSDIAFARNNNNGEKIEDFIYDEATGLLYIKKSVRNGCKDEDGNYMIGSTQLQMLYCVSDYYNQTSQLAITVDSDVKGDVADNGTIDVSASNIVIAIQLAEDDKARKNIKEDNISIVADGVEVPKDDYWYNSEDGSLNIVSDSVVNINSLEIDVDKSSAISSVIDVLFNPLMTFAKTFDEAAAAMSSFSATGISVSDSAARGTDIITTTVNYSNNGGSAMSGMYAIGYGGGSGHDDSSTAHSGDASIFYQMARQLSNNSSSYSGSVYHASGGANVTVTIPAGTYCNGQIAFSSALTTKLYCAHIYVDNDFSVHSAHEGQNGWISNVTGNSNILPNRVKLDLVFVSPDRSYAIIGLLTPSTHGQAGVVYLKVPVSSGSSTIIRPKPQSVIVNIAKQSDSPIETSYNSNYSLAGAVYTAACQDGFKMVWNSSTHTWVRQNVGPKFTNGTTGSDDKCSIKLPCGGNWTIKETSPSAGFHLDANTWTVVVDYDTSYTGLSDGEECDVLTTTSSTNITSTEPHKKGNLLLTKATDNTSIVAGNDNYSVEGARYWAKNLNDSSGRANYSGYTNASGQIVWSNIPIGTYQITEENSSKGYSIDRNLGTVWVGCSCPSCGGQTYTFSAPSDPMSETPQTTDVGIVIEKYDHEQLKYRSSVDPQGDGTMMNAKYHFKFFKETNLTLDEANVGRGTCLFEFDAVTISEGGKNVVDLSQNKSILANTFVGHNGQSLNAFFASNGKFRVPYGSLYVTEVTPPTGYTLDEVYVFGPNAQGDGVRDRNGDGKLDKFDSFLGSEVTSLSYIWNNPDITATAAQSENTTANSYVDMKGNLNAKYLQTIVYSEESMILGSVEVTKLDNMTHNITPQGDARLRSSFRIYNVSTYPVWVDLDQNGEWDENEMFAPGEAITDITTDDDTRWVTLTGGAESYSTGILPYGTYKIVEIYTTPSYRLVPWEKIFSIRTQSQIVKYNTPAEQAPENDVRRGGVEIRKFTTDFLEYYTEGDAKFEGAQFDIVNKSVEAVFDPDTGKSYAPGEVFCTITTDANGVASTIQKGEWKYSQVGSGCFLPIGTYEIHETVAPEGYLLNEDFTQTFVVSYDGEIVMLDNIYDMSDPNNADAPFQACGDLVQRSAIELYKSDNDRINQRPDGDENKGQGDASLAGAVFAVVNMSKHDVLVNGQRFKHGSVCYTFVTDENGYSKSELDTFPYGTYYIYEVMAPQGYFIDSAWNSTVYVRAHGATYTVGDYKIDPIKEAVYRSGVIGNKIDAELSTAYAQGDATLDGATIGIINRSTYSVFVEGQWYEPGEICYKHKTAQEMDIDGWDNDLEHGWWKTSLNLLPYGTYEIVELEPSAGYNLNEDYHYTLKVRKDKTWYDISKSGGTLTQQVIRGDVQIQKWDAELNASEATGGKDHGDNQYGSDMNGIQFTIKNQSEHAIVYNGNKVEPGEFVCYIYTHWNDAVGAYTAETTDKALPYGTYSIQETRSNNSYNLTDGEARTFQIREEGSVVTVDADGNDLVFKNLVRRGDIEFVKIADATSARMSTLWLLTNNTTGEQHVLATDRNGEFYSNSEDGFPHSNDTNANDKFIDDINSGKVIDIADVNVFAGIWFSVGEHGSTCEPVDERGALPFGYYTMEEVRTDSNIGFGLQTIRFYIERDGKTVNLGTITDDRISIDTIAKNTSANLTDKNYYQVTDNVTYDGLTKGIEYTLVGTLMDAETMAPLYDIDGNMIQAETTFCPKHNQGQIDNVFTFKNEGIGGKTAVVYETLYYEATGDTVTMHTDIHDVDQSVTFPIIKHTTATDSETGDHDSKADGNIKITDTVEYSGLTVGQTYICIGTLMDVDTHAEALDDNGNEISNYAIFSPVSSDGTVDVTFEFAGQNLAGHTIVVFEIIAVAEMTEGSNPSGKPVETPSAPTQPSGSNQSTSKPNNGTFVDDNGNTYTKGDTVASENDWDDKDQQIHFAKIETSAIVEKTGTHEGHTGITTIRDTVAYTNLLENESYTLNGVLADAITGEILVDKDGNHVSATQTFIAAQTDGTVEVVFDVNGDEYAGRTLVVYETLTRNNVDVAIEKNKDAKEQTIYFPAISTSASANDRVTQEALASTIKITDTVSYENVQVGQTYTVVGELRDVANGGYIYVDDESMTPVTATATFTAEATSGTVDVVFEGDVTRLAGSTIVVFESLTTGDDSIEVAKHADVSDKSQYIYIPKISTTLVDSATGLNELMAAKDVTLTDTISYENLQVGEEYIITTHVVDKSTNKDVVDAVMTRFIPETVNGSTTVDVKVDCSELAGKSLVCYESIAPASMSDYVIALHEDIEDDAQTVTIPKIETSAASGTTKNNELVVGTDSIVDTVKYENLRVGRGYTLICTLMDKATGEAIKDANGNVMTAQSSVVPTEANGEATVTFANVDTSKLQNMDIVCFEVLTREDTPLAKHEDIEDDAQTVHVPTYSTNAVFANGIDETLASGTVKVNDTFTYKNLRPGESYTVKGTLVTVGNAEELKVADKVVTSTATFKPEKEDGSTVLTFEFDASSLGGNNYVVYSELVRNDIVLMSDKANSNEDETVHFPTISGTELKDATTGIHEVLAGTTTNLVDTISYSNLKAGTEYVIKGELVKASDGTAIKSVSVKFTPSSSTGTVDVKFENVDTSAYAGTNIVAYETISKGENVVAQHKDLKDAKQTVSLPAISTSAISDDTKSKMIWVDTTTAKVTDTVTYKNLVVGNTYTVTTTLVDKATGKAASLGESAATTTTTFKAEKTEGTFDVTVTFNPSVYAGEGATLVFFESMSNGSTVVAKHEDVNDAAQTVYIMGLDTVATAEDLRAKTIDVKADAKVVDTMAYSNLVTGQKYYVHSWVMNANTGKSVADLTTEFTPSGDKGSVAITVPVNTSSLSGAKLVVFEYVYDADGKLLAAHNDLADADQTVTVKTVSIVQTGVSTYGTKIALIASIMALMSLMAFGGTFWYRKRKIENAKKANR